MTRVDATKIEVLKKGFGGKVILPEDGEYDEARKVWNAMIAKRPAVIAECAGTQDAVNALRFARENGMTLSVRGAGHHIAGNSLCDDGLVVDLSHLKAVKVDPRCEAGDRREAPRSRTSTPCSRRGLGTTGRRTTSPRSKTASSTRSSSDQSGAPRSGRLPTPRRTPIEPPSTS
jgi:hypothetical protein